MNLEADRPVNRQFLLKVLLSASIISTAIHFIDNYRFIEHYPQPAWITASLIYQSWIILTIVGIAGYWLYKFRKFWFAYLCLIVYSLTGLASLGHYLYGPLSEFSLKMHVFIFIDGITGLAVLGFVLWSSLLLKEWHST